MGMRGFPRADFFRDTWAGAKCSANLSQLEVNILESQVAPAQVSLIKSAPEVW